MGEAAKLEGWLPERIADRYRVLGELGRGGMAVVYHVHDEARDETLALKALLLKESHERSDQVAHMFQREFVTLSRLAHPRVVAVYDFGHDGERPFYTLELLDGGDLRERAPLPWRQACQILLDVCSALSLVHSRRQVHRDVTARNIRCTRDGQAKLIDFGALAPFGVSRQVVGTPPFVAPEVVASQSLDGRADLYSLGAAAYFALTGRYAYPARRFQELRDAWRSPPPPPSRYAEEIPEELDRLVMSLLHLQSLARPASAAEVMDRLAAIARLPMDEHLVVRQAYLSSPNLAGRSDAQVRARKLIMRVRQRRGGALLVTGRAGVGRSRFLDACVLEAKLMGARLARADAGDAGSGGFGAARVLANQLLVEYGATGLDLLRPHAAVISDILPSLRERYQARGEAIEANPVFETAQARRTALIEGLRAWLIALSRARPLVIAGDNLDRLDEPSAALLIAAAHAGKSEALLVLATATRQSGAELPPAVALLAEAGATLALRNLSAEHSEAVLRSVFGDVPNVALVANRIFAVTRGNPRDLMALAQHLLDRGLVRYEGGAWILPARLQADELPSSMGEALAARIDALPERVRSLLQSIALASVDAMSFSRCIALGLHAGAAGLLTDLEELEEGGWIVRSEDNYALVDANARGLIARRVEPARAAGLHQRLSRTFEECDQDPFRVASHALHAGEEARACDWMLAYARVVSDQRRDSLSSFERHRSLPDDWQQAERGVLAYVVRSNKPRPVVQALHLCLMSDGVLAGQSPVKSLEIIIEQLRHDCGLDLYEAQDAMLDPAVRLTQMLQQAQARFDATPESERGLPPAEAIPRLGGAIISAIGVAARSYDYALLARSPSLGPLTPLALDLQLIEMNRTAALHAVGGDHDRSREIYLQILARMERAEREGVDLSHLIYMHRAMQHAVGNYEVNMGIAAGVRWAELLEDSPSFVVNAVRLRMSNALRQGDYDAAERLRSQLELMRIQNSPPQIFEGTHTFAHLVAYISAEDLVRVKQTIPALEAMAEEMPTWKPIVGLARAAYRLLSGDPQGGLDEAESHLEGLSAGRHVVWHGLTQTCITCMIRLGRVDEAVAAGTVALERARDAEMTSVTCYLQQPLALALAMRGDHEQAVALAEASITSLLERGTTGVLLGEAFEVRSRIALVSGDDAAFERHSTLCAEQYRAGRNPVLTAKYERLLQLARERKLEVSRELAEAANFTRATQPEIEFAVATLLGGCQGGGERAEATLNALVERCGCEGGFLYLVTASGPTLTAMAGAPSLAADLDAGVRQLLELECFGEAEMTVTGTAEAEDPSLGDWRGSEGQHLIPVVLRHEADGQVIVTGIVALVCRSDKETEVPEDELVQALSQALYNAGDVATGYMQH